MAARLRAKHQDEVRLKIQTSQLINRLQDHALSDDAGEMASSRIKAIEILLRKSLPDLSQVEHTGDPEHPVVLRATVELISARPLRDTGGT